MTSGRLRLLELLSLRKFDSRRPAKLVRHQDERYDVQELLRKGWLETYQGFQRRPIFDGCHFIVSFVGTEGTKARLVGVYRVLGKRSGGSMTLPAECPHREWLKCDFFYELQKEAGFEDLENRVIIEWGKGALAWHQHLVDKEVVQILPPGQFRPLFRDYLEFTLTRDELENLFKHEQANVEWRRRLQAVAGVYLILATTTGDQYVGSAYGTEGIWGRWATYARIPDGGNVLLKELLDRDPAYPEHFSYSILQVLPNTYARSEVLKCERRYKEKLGCRAKGLNAN
jgi:hypothetical protein